VLKTELISWQATVTFSCGPTAA